MSSTTSVRLGRRELLAGSLAAAACAAAAPALAQGRSRGLDPLNPDIRFGTTGSIFGSWTGSGDGLALRMSSNMQMMLQACKAYGLEGFEPYSSQVGDYFERPLALKALLEETGMTLCSLGDLPRSRLTSTGPAAPAAPGAAPAYPWLGGEGRAKLVADMEACARDFLKPLGVGHWKNNMGGRPEGGPSDDQLKALADTCNEIGRRTLAHGVKLSLHPHLWGPMEREHEFRRVMELTDPAYVFLILDTGHNVLGGMDTVKITREFLPRITEVHLKDTFPQYRGNTATPTRSQHLAKGVYASVGQGGGVDFPGIFQVLRTRRFKGWAVFDIDAPRAGDGTGTVHDNLAASVRYMRDVLKVRFPEPPATGVYTEA
jgi:sugar phosphate isomerase/epimerase